MADVTNQGVPQAGGQVSGDVTRQAAIRRLKKLQEAGQAQSVPPKQGR